MLQGPSGLGNIDDDPSAQESHPTPQIIDFTNQLASHNTIQTFPQGLETDLWALHDNPTPSKVAEGSITPSLEFSTPWPVHFPWDIGFSFSDREMIGNFHTGLELMAANISFSTTLESQENHQCERSTSTGHPQYHPSDLEDLGASNRRGNATSLAMEQSIQPTISSPAELLSQQKSAQFSACNQPLCPEFPVAQQMHLQSAEAEILGHLRGIPDLAYEELQCFYTIQRQGILSCFIRQSFTHLLNYILSTLTHSSLSCIPLGWKLKSCLGYCCLQQQLLEVSILS